MYKMIILKGSNDPVIKKVLTRDEEADEIVRRLSAPPRKKKWRIESNCTVESMKDLSLMYGLDIEKK